MGNWPATASHKNGYTPISSHRKSLNAKTTNIFPACVTISYYFFLSRVSYRCGRGKKQISRKAFLAAVCVLYVDCWKGGSRAAERTLKTLSVILFLPIGYIYIYSGTFEICPRGVVPASVLDFLLLFPPQVFKIEKLVSLSLSLYSSVLSFLFFFQRTWPADGTTESNRRKKNGQGGPQAL
jgi:hypothetical protein